MPVVELMDKVLMDLVEGELELVPVVFLGKLVFDGACQAVQLPGLWLVLIGFDLSYFTLEVLEKLIFMRTVQDGGTELCLFVQDVFLQVLILQA